MTEEDILAIIAERGVRVVERGNLLFYQGDPAKFFFLILEGLVKLYRLKPDGDEAVVHIFSAGDTFAEAVMFMGGKYPVNAETISETRLIVFDGQKLRDRIALKPELAFTMLGSASRHLKKLVDQIEQMKLLSGDERVAEFILSLTSVRSGPAIFSLPYEKNLIANQLGIKPETFSRALFRLKSIGIEVKGSQITVRDMEALVMFLQQSEQPAAWRMR